MRRGCGLWAGQGRFEEFNDWMHQKREYEGDEHCNFDATHGDPLSLPSPNRGFSSRRGRPRRARGRIPRPGQSPLHILLADWGKILRFGAAPAHQESCSESFENEMGIKAFELKRVIGLNSLILELI